jgi:hypothetical protein
MGKVICPERNEAYRILCRLERAGLAKSSLWRMVAGEFDRDLLTAESRLHLALPKAAPLMGMLEAAGRSRKARAEAKAAIRGARVRVR